MSVEDARRLSLSIIITLIVGHRLAVDSRIVVDDPFPEDSFKYWWFGVAALHFYMKTQFDKRNSTVYFQLNFSAVILTFTILLLILIFSWNYKTIKDFYFDNLYG